MQASACKRRRYFFDARVKKIASEIVNLADSMLVAV
ncbi:MAG: hypothetical protein ACI8U1_003299, partial [Rheinheimera aquimaris]